MPTIKAKWGPVLQGLLAIRFEPDPKRVRHILISSDGLGMFRFGDKGRGRILIN